MSLTKYVLLSTLLMALPVSTFAQSADAPETVSTTTMVVSGQNSPVRTYAVKNLSVATSTNYQDYEQYTRYVSVTLTLLAPPDTTMLKWMRPGGPDSTKKVVITVRSESANGKASEMKYVLDAVRIIGFSAYHYSEMPIEFSVQMVATNLVINGVLD